MKVVVAISDPERESGLLETAAALAGDGEVVLASAIEVTGDATLASAQPEARARRRALDALTGELPGRHGARKPATLYQLLGERAYDERVERLVTRSGDPAKVITDELDEHDAIVFGATGREGARDPLGPIGQTIIAGARNALVVRTSAPLASPVFVERTRLPLGRAERSRVLGEITDKWFAENTFSSSEFADLRRLVEAKERQGIRISVGLPTLNEEATIRKVIRPIRSRLL